MIRTLAPEEIERVLRAEVVGRIGCHAEGRTYVVPVCFVYEAGAIYAHSGDGMKVRMMRENPAVCFEVDHVEDLVNWHSAICWGTYEELNGKDADRCMDLLRERLRERLPRMSRPGVLAAEENDGDSAAVVFRINVNESSGREERLYWDLLPKASHRLTHTEAWLSQQRAKQLADIATILDTDDVWCAADELTEGRLASQVEASLTYQGLDAEMAHTIVHLLLVERDHAPSPRAPTAAGD